MRLPFSYSFGPPPCGVWIYRMQRYGFSIKNTPFSINILGYDCKTMIWDKWKTFAQRWLGERGCAPVGSAKATDGGGWYESSHLNRCLMVTAALTRAERRGGGTWNVGTWNVERGMLNVEWAMRYYLFRPQIAQRSTDAIRGAFVKNTRLGEIFLEHESYECMSLETPPVFKNLTNDSTKPHQLKGK